MELSRGRPGVVYVYMGSASSRAIVTPLIVSEYLHKSCGDSLCRLLLTPVLRGELDMVETLLLPLLGLCRGGLRVGGVDSFLLLREGLSESCCNPVPP